MAPRASDGSSDRAGEAGLPIIHRAFKGAVILAVLLFLSIIWPRDTVQAGEDAPCGPGAPCRVPDGYYIAKAPADWDRGRRRPPG